MHPPKTLDGKPRPCKICDALSPVYGELDFTDTNNPQAIFPKSGRNVTYNRCENCGLFFSASLDHWSDAEMQTYIYNDDFKIMDPSIVTGDRARQCAENMDLLFSENRAHLSVLDHGGGQGFFEQSLRHLGYQDVQTYDPYFGDHKIMPGRRFDIVTSLEVLEHAINPVAMIKNIGELVKQDGLLFFATLLVPDNIDSLGTGWWYMNPRAGHVTLYSRKALALAFDQAGFQVASFGDFWHLAFRQIPSFAAHLFSQG